MLTSLMVNLKILHSLFCIYAPFHLCNYNFQRKVKEQRIVLPGNTKFLRYIFHLSEGWIRSFYIWTSVYLINNDYNDYRALDCLYRLLYRLEKLHGKNYDSGVLDPPFILNKFMCWLKSKVLVQKSHLHRMVKFHCNILKLLSQQIVLFFLLSLDSLSF